MTVSIPSTISRTAVLLFILVLGPVMAFGQTQSAGGVINQYTRITSVGADFVLVDDTSPFNVGDTVLVIQMRGAEITVGAADFGFIEGKRGDYGYYEFLIVELVEPGPKKITFRNNLLGTYDPESSVQLVRVPRFDNVSVDATLTCEPWDSTTGTGGVLAFIAGNNVYLNSNIDVSGKGFAGGLTDEISGSAVGTLNIWPDLLFFNEATNTAARKGKGIASHIRFGGKLFYDDYSRGKGRFGNGGGGGNGRYAGGGGGSSYGTGGSGGPDMDLKNVGGIYGADPNTIWVLNEYKPIVMGGGGGAGGHSATGTGSDGAPGGAIIFILADTIFGNGNSIISDGGDVWPVIAAGEGGAGGGGAAGAIVINASFDDGAVTNIYARGGDGGHSSSLTGNGGGESGCLIFASSDLVANPNVNTSLIQGKRGLAPYSGSPSLIPSGQVGQATDTLLMRLNGFLFNSIVSDVSKSSIDSICEGTIPPDIIGTTPVGGKEPYFYYWQRRTDDGSWSAPIPGLKNYFPASAETDTVFFRRIVEDSSPLTISDTSKAVKIIVQPLITGNSIGFADNLTMFDTICFGQDPAAIIPLATLGGGNFNSAYPDSAFWWGASTVNTNPETWAVAPGSALGRQYDTTILETTHYYYRVVRSGQCIDTSNVATIEVLPVIAGNTIDPSSVDTIVCQDDILADIIGTEGGSGMTGGDGVYRYFWEQDGGGGFGPIGETARDYLPDEITFTRDAPQYFRRTVYSGKGDRCVSISDTVSLLMWTRLSNNILTPSATPNICEDDIPALIQGSLPDFGDPAERIYTWESSTDNFTTVTAIVSGNGLKDYQPGPLTQTTWYRRRVKSSACENISDTVVVNVQAAIANNNIFGLDAIADTALCFNGDPNPIEGTTALTGGDGSYAYEWLENTTGTWVPATGLNTNYNYDPVALQQTTIYRRIVLSGECIDTTATEVTVSIYPLITNNIITPGQVECYGEPGSVITGTALSGGKPADTPRFEWLESTDMTGWITVGGDVQDLNPGIITQDKYFRRIVKSGELDCCIDTSSVVTVTFDEIPSDAIAGPDTALVPFQDDYIMQAVPVMIGTGSWSIFQSDGSPGINSVNDPATRVTGLGDGDNIFKWTVVNGACDAKVDDVVINVKIIRIYSGFSPNGDGMNETFEIEGIWNTDNELIITDMSGTVVFRVDNYQGDWEGYDMKGNRLPDGTYYYFLNITRPVRKQLKGFIVIKRSF